MNQMTIKENINTDMVIVIMYVTLGVELADELPVDAVVIVDTTMWVSD